MILSSATSVAPSGMSVKVRVLIQDHTPAHVSEQRVHQGPTFFVLLWYNVPKSFKFSSCIPPLKDADAINYFEDENVGKDVEWSYVPILVWQEFPTPRRLVVLGWRDIKVQY